MRSDIHKLQIVESGISINQSFMKSIIPNSGTWMMIFHPGNETRANWQACFSKMYFADVSAVNGTVINGSVCFIQMTITVSAQFSNIV